MTNENFPSPEEIMKNMVTDTADDDINSKLMQTCIMRGDEVEKYLPDKATYMVRGAINEKYGSIAKFADAIHMPATTIASALRRGIGATSVDKAIKIFNALGLDINTFEPKEEDDPPEQVVYQLTLPKEDDDLLKAFRQLNPQNKKKVQEYVGDLLELQTYRESNK